MRPERSVSSWQSSDALPAMLKDVVARLTTARPKHQAKGVLLRREDREVRLNNPPACGYFIVPGSRLAGLAMVARMPSQLR